MLPVSNRDGQMLDMLDAMFTATSATCVTGLVVFDTYTQFSTFGQVVILLLIQVGGAGAGNAYHIFQHCRRASAGLQKPSPCQREHQPFGRQPGPGAAAVRYEGRLCFRGHRCGAACSCVRPSVRCGWYFHLGVHFHLVVLQRGVRYPGPRHAGRQRYSLSEQSVRFGCYFTAHHQRRTGLSCLAGPFGLPPYTPPAHTHKAGFVDHRLAAPAGHCGHPVHGV